MALLMRLTHLLIAVAIVGCAGSSSTTSTTIAPSTTEASLPTTTQAATTTQDQAAVLVYTATAGFRHDSIPAGVTLVEELGQASGFEVTASEDPSVFAELADYDTVVFLNTTGDILDPAAQQAMEEFMARGGGFVGIHSATDTEYDWPWYGGLVGTYFADHPQVQEAALDVVSDHPVVAGITPRFTLTDEWYNFTSPLPAEIDTLMTVDESTYEGGTMGDTHPVLWAREYGGGRAVYMAMGHPSEVFSEPMVRRIVSNAISWVGKAD